MNHRISYRLVEIVGTVAFLLYIVLRAIKIPITHDEAGTILNFSTQSVWDIITYRDPIPNNHLLNTLLIKSFTSIVGLQEWVCRLPNILAGLVYFLFGLRIFRNLFPSDLWMQFISMLLIIANPYLMEFFSLARGYGLSVGIMMISLYYLIKANEKDYALAVLFGGISVYANLTLLNYFIPLVILISLRFISRPFNRTLVVRMAMTIFTLAILLTIPIIKMINTNQFQFWNSNGFYQDTFVPLLRSSIQGKAYFSQYTELVFSSLIGLAILLIVIGLIRLLAKGGYKVMYIIPIPFVFIGTILYNLLQKWILHIPYLNARTSLFFYTLFILAICSLLSIIRKKQLKKILYKIFLIMGVMSAVHIARCYNLKSTYEWWYDADNKEVISVLERDAHLNNKVISFKCDWLFQPSMTFYIQGQHRPEIISPPYNKSIDSTDIVDYYLVTSDDMNPWLLNNYHIEQAYAWNTRFLMKKNELNRSK